LSVVFAFASRRSGRCWATWTWQLRRSGEEGRERALIGLTLSYTIIVIAVVVLVIWAVTGGESGSSSSVASRHRHWRRRHRRHPRRRPAHCLMPRFAVAAAERR
jgi:hypothetical protein